MPPYSIYSHRCWGIVGKKQRRNTVLSLVRKSASLILWAALQIIFVIQSPCTAGSNCLFRGFKSINIMYLSPKKLTLANCSLFLKRTHLPGPLIIWHRKFLQLFNRAVTMLHTRFIPSIRTRWHPQIIFFSDYKINFLWRRGTVPETPWLYIVKLYQNVLKYILYIWLHNWWLLFHLTIFLPEASAQLCRAISTQRIFGKRL